VGLFKMNQGLVISGYLKYWLDSSLMMHILQEKDLIRGTTQKFIALGGLRVLPVPVPSVNEQSEILNEIESRFSVCNKLEETIESSLKRAEALRQSILKQAFEGNLTEHWRKEHKDLISGENSAEALLKKIKAEKEALQVKPKGKK
jgi:type I restriction enzyme S subunit